MKVESHRPPPSVAFNSFSSSIRSANGRLFLKDIRILNQSHGSLKDARMKLCKRRSVKSNVVGGSSPTLPEPICLTTGT